jgi:hypothetical protein
VLTGNNPPPPHNHEGGPPATKLLAVLTGNTDATGSPKHPLSINPDDPRRNHPHSPALDSIFIPHHGAKLPWQLLAEANSPG